MAIPKRRIVLTAGGTGGHLIPIIAMAEELQRVFQKNGYSIDLHFVGAPGIYEKDLINIGVKVHKIMAGKLRRYFSLETFIDIPKAFVGLIQAFIKIYFLMPDTCFSKGGPGALQVVLASRFYLVPIVIHESDAYPGLTSLLSARFAKKIGISFESVAPYFSPKKTVMTGNPIRPSLLRQKLSTGAAKEALGFDGNSPLVLILGGSQGSQRINEFIIALLKELIGETQILHQSGSANYDIIKKMSQATLVDVSVAAEVKSRYKVVPYLEGKEMAYALSAADLVVGRAGSGTIFEIAAFGKPSLLVPLPEAAGDHQRENAYAYAGAHAAFVIEEANFSPQIFLAQIKKLLGNAEALKAMGENAQRFAKPDAAEKIAEIVFALA